MPAIIVCPLTLVDRYIALHTPSRLVSLLDPASMIDTPAALEPSSHLKLSVNDIPHASEGLIVPGATHVQALLNFVDAWDGASPILIHCWAGVSRSTASAIITACRLNPHIAEATIINEIRALSPTATPNTALIALADDMLSRNGRMVDAVAAIGRGADCFEGVPFSIPARWAA